MKRLLVQLDPDVYRRLRKRAFAEERSISAVVREMVGRGLDDGGARKTPSRARQFLSVRAGRSKQNRQSPVSEKHDAALAAAFEK
jgi:plasmid stability protein